MDGVFVAYHNTREIFGFQYISLEEMDQRLYGHNNGQRVFGKCVGLLDALFTEITKYFPEQVRPRPSSRRGRARGSSYV